MDILKIKIMLIKKYRYKYRTVLYQLQKGGGMFVTRLLRNYGIIRQCLVSHILVIPYKLYKLIK